MDTDGSYPAEPTQTADYKCGLGSQINLRMIHALAEGSGLPLTVDGERVRYLEEAEVTSNTGNSVFGCKLDENGAVLEQSPAHITVEAETSEGNPYRVVIRIARKKYTVTLTADTHVSGVRFGDTGAFLGSVTERFCYGATVTAQADVAPGYRFTYWDPQDPGS